MNTENESIRRFKTNDCFRSIRSVCVEGLAIRAGYLLILVIVIGGLIWWGYEREIDYYETYGHYSAWTNICFIGAIACAVFGIATYISTFPFKLVNRIATYHPNRVFPVKGCFDISVFASNELAAFLAEKTGIDDDEDQSYDKNYIIENLIIKSVTMHEMRLLLDKRTNPPEVELACPAVLQDTPMLVLRENQRYKPAEKIFDLSLLFRSVGHSEVEVDEQKLDVLLDILKERWPLVKLSEAIEEYLTSIATVQTDSRECIDDSSNSHHDKDKP